MLQSSADILAISTDAAGVIRFFNVGAERRLGYAAGDVVDRRALTELQLESELAEWAEVVRRATSPTDETDLLALVWSASRQDQDPFEPTYVCADGGRVSASTTVAVLRDVDGSVVGYLYVGAIAATGSAAVDAERAADRQGVFASAQDTTELKRYERELERKNIELVAADHMKSEFLANMSHELRTPLNAILGFSEVLKDGLAGELNGRQTEFANDIFTSGRHLLSLINDILDLSKIEAGKMELDLEPVHLPSVVQNSLSIIKEKAASRRIRLDPKVDATLEPLQVDPRRVKQILYNMLSNAVKFSAEGGHVVIGVERVPLGDVGKLDGVRPGRALPLMGASFAEYVRISVADDGIGIAEEALEQLFQPFGQIDSGLAREFEGSGLGLALIKVLAEMHGGTVAVESAEGEGSRFTVWLPLRPVGTDPTERSLGDNGGSSEAHDRTAMIVEDDFKSAELIRIQLESEGFRVILAASAEAGLALATLQPLDLITVDIMLPNMDGWEFLTRLKSIPQLQRVPVVMISILEDRARGTSLGAAGVLQKPITRQDLYNALEQLNLLPVAPEQTLTVLAVDDDPRAVELVATRMAGIATRILRAYGGEEAIEIAQRERPNVIVLDLMMPRVNGFEVAAALTEDVRTKDIPILVVTAKELTADDRDRLHGHVAAVMDKVTFTTARLTTEIRRALAGRKGKT